jgi:hypothetical protein
MKPLEDSHASLGVEIRKILTISVGLAGMALTAGTMAVGGFIALPTAVCAGALSAMLLWGSFNPEKKNSPEVGSLLGRGCLYGGLNAFPSFIFTTLVLGELAWINEAPFVLLAVGMCGLIVGVPLGLLYSTCYLIPFQKAAHILKTNALEGRDVVLKYTGVWLASVAAGALAFGLLVGVFGCSNAHNSYGPDRWLQVAPLLLACGLPLFGGLGAALLAERRLRQRRAWLWKVLKGEEPDVAVISADQVEVSAERVRPLLVEATLPSHLIVKVRPGEAGGAYRRETELIPIALIETDRETLEPQPLPEATAAALQAPEREVSP